MRQTSTPLATFLNNAKSIASGRKKQENFSMDSASTLMQSVISSGWSKAESVFIQEKLSTSLTSSMITPLISNTPCHAANRSTTQTPTSPFATHIIIGTSRRTFSPHICPTSSMTRPSMAHSTPPLSHVWKCGESVLNDSKLM